MTAHRVIIAVAFIAVVVATPALVAQIAPSGAVPPSKERGFKPELVYQFGEFDNVTLFNGNLTATIPLGPTYPVGAGLSYGFTLRYSGNLWQTVDDCRYVHNPNGDDGCVNLVLPRMENGGLGWRLSFGRLRPPAAGTEPGDGTALSKWAYLSPDGSEHLFWPALHNECVGGNTAKCDPKVDGVEYSRDGTYLRIKRAAASAVVEFPNGERHRFENHGTAADPDWRLHYIYNTFSATDSAGIPSSNYVKIEYEANATAGVSDTWKVSDSHERQHTVTFRESPMLSEEEDLVHTVEIEGFRGAGTDRVPVTYTLGYDLLDSSGNFLTRPCAGSVDTVRAALLTSVELPSTASWSFTYDKPATQAACSARELSGTMLSARLPTQGKIKWTYQTVGYGNTAPHAVGVKTRIVEADSADVEQTEYQTSIGQTKVLRKVKVGSNWNPAVVVTQKHVSQIGTVDFGLPYDPAVSDDAGRHPSSETEICNPQTNVCSKVRETHVKYEWDYHEGCLSDYPCMQNRNRRVAKESTTFVDDGNKVADVNYLQFDGLGHYRLTQTAGTFNSGNVRESEINYNPLVGTYILDAEGKRQDGFTMLDSATPWLLNTYDKATETEGPQTAHSQACFDGKGFLTRTRRMASATPAADDLISVFTADSAGFVASEEHFGGVKNAVPVDANLCTPATLGTSHDAYTVWLEHQYEYGSLKTSEYLDADGTEMLHPFFVVDNVIDAWTGLVYQSKDTAGEVTTVDYDTSARLVSVTPPDLASTSYIYTEATASQKAKVTVETGSGSDRIASEVLYDRLGRVWQEKTLMPGGIWSVRETLYDALGRRQSVSERGSGAPSSSKTTFSDYDAFGRPGKVTLPDGSSTIYTYSGNRETKRTQTIATSTTAEASVSVSEELDRAGRLIKVTEHSDGGTAAAVTTYEYDVGNRLKLVTMSDGAEPVPLVQEREFNYDVRGWLSSEEHPESGLTTFQRDARGNVVTRTTPVATLTFAYDRAERLTAVKEGSLAIKEFTYDTATGSGLGKVAKAIRHHRNTPLGLDVTITETYTYNGKGGRMSEKKTERNNGESFTDTYTYDTFGQLETIGYPGLPARTVTNKYANGLLNEVVGYTTVPSLSFPHPISYHPNGMVSQIRHQNAGGANGPLYEQTLDSGMARTGSITVSNYCEDFAIGGQPQDKTVSSGAPANVTVTAEGATTFQWFRGSSTTPLPNQTTATLTEPVTQATTFWVRAGNGTCTIDSRVVTVTICDAPNATITAPATVFASQTATASVATAATYQWSIEGGTILGGHGTNEITFRAGCSGSVVLNVTVGNECEASSSRSVAVTPASVVVNDPDPIDQGGSTALAAAVNGTQPFTLEWSDNVTQTNVGSFASRTAAPIGTTTYSVVATDQHGCSDSDTALVIVYPPPPYSLVATATSVTSVLVSWQFIGYADQFLVYRNGSPVGTTTSHSFEDGGIPAAQSFMYEVQAVKSGTASRFNPRDLATTVMLDSIIAGTTQVSAAHFVHLQAAVNAVRQLAGLSPFAFADVSPGVPINAAHIQQLRTALAQARSALFVPAITYSHPAAVGDLIRAADVTELQGGVR